MRLQYLAIPNTKVNGWQILG